MSDFVHLHVHTQYSILDGACDIKTLVNRCKELGMNSLAITDHGNMFGVLSFIKEAQKAGIKPIIGCEVYVARNSISEKTTKDDRRGYHLILLAKNLVGYHNLARLVSLANIDGFYFVPRVDKDLLRKYSEGLIASSACLAGEISATYMQKGIEAAEECLLDYLEIFKEDFYIELMRHGWPEQNTVNPILIKMAQKYNVKMIATNDVHYINKEDAKAHDILICLNTNKDIDDVDRMTYSGLEYLKSPEEMAELFSDVPEAVSNTVYLASQIEEYSLKQKPILPYFPIPDNFKDENEYLEHITFEGAKRLYGELSPVVEERLRFELETINNMGFAGYFLIVSDFINEGKRQGVSVGPGRGSAAGSAVAYCTGITSIDPIKYNLLFERFLNPERVNMPDIDIDFDDDGREKVIQYVIDKYGKDKVAQIVTFGTMAAKGSIRDVARVLKLSLPEADYLAKLVPAKPDTTLKSAFKDVKELSDAKAKGSDLVKKTLMYAEQLEGSVRQTGVHACGVIIGKDPLLEHIPLCRAKDSNHIVTQYEGKEVEDVGLLKMDFLGLKTLSIINDAIKNIYARHKIQIDIEKIPLEDELTFQLYQRGDTVGTFQFESEGMRMYLRDLKPNNIEDLIAMNALYRPGPMSFIPLYIRRKHGKEKVEYPDPMLEEILKPTYGIMVYQEQIMQAAQIMAGYTLAAADLLRRAMGKKETEVMKKQRSIFVEGAKKKGIDEAKASKVFEIMEKFAEYGFNRSHSAAYSMVAYQTGYLKAHYPAEYMAAVLSRHLGDLKKVTGFIDECKRMGIKVLGPDINESISRFTVNNTGEVRFGMSAVKGVGEAAVEAIVTEREKNGPYSGLFDFARRVNLRACNKKCLESLAKAGAFDSFSEIHRAQFFTADSDGTIFIDKLIRHANENAKNALSMQQSLFGEMGDVEIADPQIPECERWTEMEALFKEFEVTGFFINGHPLDQYALEVNSLNNLQLTDFEEIAKIKAKEFVIAGMITEAQHKTTKTGKQFGSFTLSDYSGSYQFSIFGEDYLRFMHLLLPHNFILLKGKIAQRYNSEDILEAKVLNMELLSLIREKAFRGITIITGINEINPGLTQKLLSIFKNHKGKAILKVAIVSDDGSVAHFHSKDIKIDLSNSLLQELESLGCLKIKPILASG